MRKAIGFQGCEVIVATGPKRKLILNSRMPTVHKFYTPYKYKIL